jgi:transcriptional regulator with XRE-family HTH domain
MPAMRESTSRMLADAIRRERLRRHKTQIDVARELRVNQAWVSRIELGETGLKVDDYMKVARVVGFDPCKLLRAVY